MEEGRRKGEEGGGPSHQGPGRTTPGAPGEGTTGVVVVNARHHSISRTAG